MTTRDASLNAERSDNANRSGARAPLREHVANSVRRYIGDLNGSGTDNLYQIALRELEIPLFVEVLNHCDGTRAAPPRCSASPARRCAQSCATPGSNDSRRHANTHHT